MIAYKIVPLLCVSVSSLLGWSLSSWCCGLLKQAEKIIKKNKIKSHVKYSLNLKSYKSAVFSLFVLAGATIKLCLCSNLFNFGVPPFDTLDSSFRRRYEPNLVQQAPMIKFLFSKSKNFKMACLFLHFGQKPQSVFFLPLTA